MQYLDEYKILQIELSTSCNALCVGCIRTEQKTLRTTKEYIPKNKYLDKNIIKKALQSEIGKEITTIDFCGTIDEPFLHPEFYEIILMLFEMNKNYFIKIHTNGGVKNKSIYQRVSRLLSHFSKPGEIKFSIDGLEDTNHLYRHNVNWSTVLENLELATNQGAVIIWQFIEFPWNKHQVTKAQELSKEMGVNIFYLRPDRSHTTSLGLAKIKEIRANKIPTPRPVRSKGNIDTLKNFIKNKDQGINCFTRQNKMIFLSWDEKIWPCCFIPNTRYQNKVKFDLFNKYIIDKYEQNFNNLVYHDLDTILNHPFFKNDLVSSWENNSQHKKTSFRCVDSCSACKTRESDSKLDKKGDFNVTTF